MVRYRLARRVFWVGSLCTPFFLAIGTLSVYFFCTDPPDGARPMTLWMELIVGGFWLGMASLGISLIVAYFREWLAISDLEITKQGIFFLRTIRRAEVWQIRWKGNKGVGKILVRGEHASLQIDLGNYTKELRTELIQFFRESFDPALQKGWEPFVECSTPKPVNPRNAVQLVISCSAIFFIFGAVDLYTWWNGFGWQFLPVGIGCVLAGGWYLWRVFKFSPPGKE